MKTAKEKLAKAIEEAETLNKSIDALVEGDDVTALNKALEDLTAVETQIEELESELAKSKDNDEDDEGDDEGDDDGDDEGDDDEGEGKVSKALAKALEDGNLEEELIKASEAYADLTKSVEDGNADIREHLNIVEAKVDLIFKSMTVIAKATEKLGGRPAAPHSPFQKSQIGEGSEGGEGGEATTGFYAKTPAEQRSLLSKAIQGGKIDALWLGKHAAKKQIPDYIIAALDD